MKRGVSAEVIGSMQLDPKDREAFPVGGHMNVAPTLTVHLTNASNGAG
ncbi:hypothetical protein [Gymnodinialimonas sp. 57CJ19]